MFYTLSELSFMLVLIFLKIINLVVVNLKPTFKLTLILIAFLNIILTLKREDHAIYFLFLIE